MERYYKIQIGTTYLTDTGGSSGLACRARVTGLDALFLGYSGRTVIAADGSPINVLIPTGTKGRPIKIELPALERAVFDLVIAQIQTAIQEGELITIIFTGGFGNFTVNALPTMPSPVEFGGADFTGNRLKNLTFNFTTAA